MRHLDVDHPCAYQDCPNPAAKDGQCWAHLKRHQRGRTLSAPILRHPPPDEKLSEAALAYAEAEGDAEYAAADERLRRAAVALTAPQLKALRGKLDSLRREVRELRDRVSHVGRPRKVSDSSVVGLVVASGGVARAAQTFGVSVRTIQRALRRGM